MPLEVAKQRTGGNCLMAYRFARSRKEMLDEACESLEKTARQMKKYADNSRRPLKF